MEIEYVIGFIVIIIGSLVLFYYKDFGNIDTTSIFSITKAEPLHLPYRRKPSLITNAEKQFFKVLSEVAGDRYFIVPQVNLSDLVWVDYGEKYQKTYRSKIDKKSVDFVLCDKVDFSPVLAIELDDKSHLRPDRVERDYFVEELFKKVEIPLLRVKKESQYNTDELTQRIKKSLGLN